MRGAGRILVLPLCKLPSAAAAASPAGSASIFPLPPPLVSRSTLQIVDEFIAAHPTRKVSKAWVQAALKEHAEHLGASKGWALKPSGLALLDAAAPAAVAAEGGTAAVAAAGAAAPAPTPGAAAAAAAAEGAGAAAAAAGGVEPTPAAAKPASGAAGIERFFKKVSNRLMLANKRLRCWPCAIAAGSCLFAVSTPREAYAWLWLKVIQLLSWPFVCSCRTAPWPPQRCPPPCALTRLPQS